MKSHILKYLLISVTIASCPGAQAMNERQPILTNDPTWKVYIKNSPPDENGWNNLLNRNKINNVLVKYDKSTQNYNAHNKEFYSEVYPSQSKICDVRKYVFIVDVLKKLNSQ